MASGAVDKVNSPQTTLQPRNRSLRDNEELTRATTKYMVGTLEWAAPIFQGVTVFASGVYDPYTDHSRTIVLGLALAHLLLIPAYARGFGPFARGGWWMTWCVLQCLSVNAVLATLSREGTYANVILGVPGSIYSATLWLFLAFYPWLPPSRIRLRVLFEWLLLSSYYAYFLVLAWLKNGELTWLNVKSAGMSFLWLLIGYLFGKAIGKMCVAAAQKQLEVQQQNFEEFFAFLHSHVKSSIAAIRMDLGDPLRVREKLDELEKTISSYRVELLLAQEQVPLAALFSERIRTFTGILEVTGTPRLGALTVARPIGVLVGRALGDLLKNAAKYGATAVQISCDISDGKICLEIADNGPGFPAEVLDDDTRSLHRLRLATRDLGGDLTMRPRDKETGAVLILVVPLRVPEAIK